MCKGCRAISPSAVIAARSSRTSRSRSRRASAAPARRDRSRARCSRASSRGARRSRRARARAPRGFGRIIASVSPTESLPACSSRSASVCPRRSSMTSTSNPCASSRSTKSNARTIARCDSCAVAYASRRKRSSASDVARRSGRSTLAATSAPVAVFRAIHTCPMPPRRGGARAGTCRPVNPRRGARARRPTNLWTPKRRASRRP